MRIGILTHYDVNNQGAQLQLYASYMQLKEMGYDPVVLTYRKNYDFDPILERRNQITWASTPYILHNFLFKKGIGLTWHNVKKYLKNRKFRKSKFDYESYCIADIDAAIVGADEVFSLELGANMMMYGHGVNTKNMIAYAPSIGQTDLQRIERYHCRNLIASGLSEFIALSARDLHTLEVIKELTGKDAEIVCDPVLLYNFPLYKYQKPDYMPKSDYLVVYSYDARMVDPLEVAAIQKYACKEGLLTVSVGTYHKWCDRNISCDPLQWLKYIENAKAIITDTFHGTIASVITQCPMAVHYSQTVNSNKMLDLIDRLGLQERCLQRISTEEIERVFSHEMDFESLSKKVNDFRESSLSYLKKILSKIE